MAPAGRVALLLIALSSALVLAFGVGPGAPAASAQDEPPPTFDGAVPVQAPRIVVEPNSGQAPTYEGQRGTTSQFVVLGAILVGLGAIVAMATRESRRKRAGQTRSSTRSEPVDETSEKQPDSSARQ